MLNKTKAALQGRSSNTTNSSQNINMLVLHSQDDKRDLVNSGKYSCLIAMFPDNFGLPNTISTPKYFGTAYRGKAAPKFLGRAKNAKSLSAHNPFLSMKSVGTKLRRVHSPKYLGQSLGSMPKRSNSLRQAVLTHELKGSSPITELICSSKSSSNRIVRLVLLERSYGFLSFSSCIGSNHYVSLCEYGANHFIGDNHKKQCPAVLETLTGHLTTNDNLSIEVAMYKYTFLIGKGKARLSDINPIRLITVLAQSESEARSLAGNSCLIFAGRLPVQEVSHA